MVRGFDWDPMTPAVEGIEGGARPPPIHLEEEPSEYRNDVSKIFVSLNSIHNQDSAGDNRAARRVKGGVESTDDSTGSSRTSGISGGGKVGVGGESRGRTGRREDHIREKSEPESPRSDGAMAEYFSSLFDESFCCQDFKLEGSMKSGKAREEQNNDCVSRDPTDGSSFTDRASGDDSSHSTGGSGAFSGGSSAYEDSTSQLSDGEPWGWFDELENDGHAGHGGPVPTTTKTTPAYILTESLSAQRLWRETAGKRPRQPSPEREHFEKQWNKNFTASEVDYSAHRRAAKAVTNKRTRQTTKVLYRAASPFGSAVSKSFMCDKCRQITPIMVHIPKFQIVQTGSDVRAEYLIVVGLGSVTLGVWRRFSEFKRLAKKLSSSSRKDQFHNALCSWRCLRERQRWFRCLDRDYLILKTFLLERFLHDFVFESVSPNTVRDFLGVL